MADPKGASAQTTPAADVSTVAQFIAIGRLRRDLLIVAQGPKADVIQQAKDAVSQGRASEVFVTKVEAYVSESEVRWDDTKIDSPDQVAPAESDGPALLNSHSSAAKSVAKAAEGKSELEPTTVQAERQKAADKSKTSADLVDGEEAQREANKD